MPIEAKNRLTVLPSLVGSIGRSGATPVDVREHDPHRLPMDRHGPPSPPRRVVGWLARVGPVRHRVWPTAKLALEDAADGVGWHRTSRAIWGGVWPWALSRTIW